MWKLAPVRVWYRYEITVWHCDFIPCLHEGTLHADRRDCDAILNWISKTAHALPVPDSRNTAAKWVRMLHRFVIRAWIDYECSTSIAKFTPVTAIFLLLNKICDGGSSKEPFLKAVTLSILILAYPCETKTNNGNFKNAAILPSKVAYRWRACALILPLCWLSGECERPYRVYMTSEWVFAPEWKSRSGNVTGVNSHRYDSLHYEILCWYHVNEYRATRGNWSELVPEWKSHRHHVNTP